MNRKVKSRASARYWIDIATAELRKRGPTALTIDALCRKTGKTKGSFYAHFENHDAFLAALAAEWRRRNTEAIIANVDTERLPRNRLAKLNQAALRLDADLERGLRWLAEGNAIVATAVAEIDRARTSYLAGLYQAVRGRAWTEAMDLAVIEYAAYVGLQFLRPKRDTPELERLHRAFERFISRGA